MKLLAAFAILLIGANASVLPVPSEAIAEGKNDARFIEGIIADILDLISNYLAANGYDPYEVDSLEYQYRLPVTDLFALDAELKGLKLAGGSNIVLHNINYAVLASRLTFDVSLPRLSAAVDSSALDVTFFGGNLNVGLGGSVALVETRLKVDVRINISVIGGISIRTLDIDFTLRGIESELDLRIQDVDYSEPINKLLGATIPNALEANRDELNELLEYIVLQIAESIL
ncbi:uncharacterized protein LOC131844271 [Achroia grisella]|uniref:uncharacterized protein LOC131844271 n=1 Tax=Achroia grisella TaxID=688607 RepID=UPI0027D2204F|nr:uncharacterized protein LOC131844271 [Achroia grisella]